MVLAKMLQISHIVLRIAFHPNAHLSSLKKFSHIISCVNFLSNITE